MPFLFLPMLVKSLTKVPEVDPQNPKYYSTKPQQCQEKNRKNFS